MDRLLSPESAAGFLVLGLLSHLINNLVSTQLRIRRRKTALWVIPSVLLVALVAIQAFSSPPSPELFRVGVSVKTNSNQALNNVRLSSSVGGEIRTANGGWEIVIPAATLSGDHRVEIRAEAAGFTSGTATVLLADDPQPRVAIDLEPRMTMLRGIVQDEQARSMPGVRVHVVGYGDESVATDRNGAFAVPAHAAEGQEVRVRAELAGFEPADQFHVLSEVAMTIKLIKATQ